MILPSHGPTDPANRYGEPWFRPAIERAVVFPLCADNRYLLRRIGVLPFSITGAIDPLGSMPRNQWSSLLDMPDTGLAVVPSFEAADFSADTLIMGSLGRIANNPERIFERALATAVRRGWNIFCPVVPRSTSIGSAMTGLEERGLVHWCNACLDSSQPALPSVFPYIASPVVAILSVDRDTRYMEVQHAIDTELQRAQLRVSSVSANGYSVLHGATWQLPWNDLVVNRIDSSIGFLASCMDQLTRELCPDIITVSLPTDSVYPSVEDNRLELSSLPAMVIASSVLTLLRPDACLLCCRHGTGSDRLALSKDALEAHGYKVLSVIVDASRFLSDKFSSPAGLVDDLAIRAYNDMLADRLHVPCISRSDSDGIADMCGSLTKLCALRGQVMDPSIGEAESK